MRLQHKGIGRHNLRYHTPLILVEGEADRNPAVIQTAGAGKCVPQRRYGLIGIAVLNQQPRLFTPLVGCG